MFRKRNFSKLYVIFVFICTDVHVFSKKTAQVASCVWHS